ncbi:MAG: type II secretion system protein [Symploca sp. SIO2E6]|nr:type II secretion system protein [Symploca sp. SIO2E6]
MLSKRFTRSNQGFTILEALFVVMMIGILGAIGAPSWTAFISRQQTNDSIDQIYQAMQEARKNARRDKITWQVSFRQVNLQGKELTQFSIHPADAQEFIPNNVINNKYLWSNLEPNIIIDQSKNDKDKYETSITKHRTDTPTGPWRVQFNYQGCPVRKPTNQCGQTSIQALGRVTLRSTNGGEYRRCVIISTLLGAIRKGENHPKPDRRDKYCY